MKKQQWYEGSVAAPYSCVCSFSSAILVSREKGLRSEQLAARCGVEPADCSRLLLTELLHYSALVSCCCSGGAPGGLATPTLAHHQHHPTYWIGAAFVPTIQPQISKRGLECFFSMAHLWAKPCYPLIQSHLNGHSFLCPIALAGHSSVQVSSWSISDLREGFQDSLHIHCREVSSTVRSSLPHPEIHPSIHQMNSIPICYCTTVLYPPWRVLPETPLSSVVQLEFNCYPERQEMRMGWVNVGAGVLS